MNTLSRDLHFQEFFRKSSARYGFWWKKKHGLSTPGNGDLLKSLRQICGNFSVYLFSPAISVSVRAQRPDLQFWPRQAGSKAFDWLRHEAGSEDWRRRACWYNCRLSERGKSGSPECSVLDGTRHREVLSGAWERRMTNQASESSAGGRWVCELECVFLLFVTRFGHFLRSRSEQQLSMETKKKGDRAWTRRLYFVWLPRKDIQTN